MNNTLILAVLIMMVTACQQQVVEPAQSNDQPQTPKACTKDLKICDDGQRVGRDINNQCQFFACPPPQEPAACPQDMKQCPDGSFVYRDPAKDCDFKPCTVAKTEQQAPEPMMCTQEVKQCADGSYVGRDPMKGCDFKPCDN